VRRKAKAQRNFWGKSRCTKPSRRPLEGFSLALVVVSAAKRLLAVADAPAATAPEEHSDNSNDPKYENGRPIVYTGVSGELPVEIG
jgi:hypothetical protein